MFTELGLLTRCSRLANHDIIKIMIIKIMPFSQRHFLSRLQACPRWKDSMDSSRRDTPSEEPLDTTDIAKRDGMRRHRSAAPRMICDNEPVNSACRIPCGAVDEERNRSPHAPYRRFPTRVPPTQLLGLKDHRTRRQPMPEECTPRLAATAVVTTKVRRAWQCSKESAASAPLPIKQRTDKLARSRIWRYKGLSPVSRPAAGRS